MIMSAVLSPDIFVPEIVGDKACKLQVEMFFRGINNNGVMLTDPEGTLERNLINNIKILPSSLGQRFNIWVEEFMKNKRRRIIKCDEIKYQQLTTKKTANLCAETVVMCCNADALISTDSYINAKCPASSVVQISNYVDSLFENKRRYFVENLPPIDSIAVVDLEDILCRSVKFSKWLRFYDKQIGSGKNTSQFRKGIEYVIGIWLNNCHFNACRDIQVITATTSNDTDEYLRLENKLRTELIEPIKNNHNVNISLCMKKDDNSIFHARHLEAQIVVLNFDRGFDLFTTGKSVKRNFIKNDNAAFLHLRECRELPDVFIIN